MIDGFKAYRVRLNFDLVGVTAETDLYYPYDPEIDDERDESARLHKLLTPEIRSALDRWFALLPNCGCITGDRDDETPNYFLVVDDKCDIPAIQFPWFWDNREERCIGLETGIELKAVQGASLQICAWLEDIEADQAFKMLRSLKPDHETSPWGGKRTLGSLPMPDEPVECWLQRVAVSAEYMQRVCHRLRLFRHNPFLAWAMPPHSSKAAPEFIVDGLLPLGDTAILVAQSGIGKSSLCHQLLAVASAPIPKNCRKTFLGREVPHQFFTALISGEESDWYYLDRRDALERIWDCDTTLRYSASKSDLPEILADLSKFAREAPGGRRGLLEIDSVQAFIDGDDTKAHAASDFHQMLRSWAIETGWCVLGIHHTTKAAPRSIAQFKSSVRGSSVHVDMPRNVFGLIDRGSGLLEFGVIKSNMPPKFAWLTEGQGALCRRNSETGIFELADGNVRASQPVPESNNMERIVTAVRQLNLSNRVAHRTGRNGLYSMRLPALTGMRRASIETMVQALIVSGRLSSTKAGLIAIEDPAIAA